MFGASALVLANPQCVNDRQFQHLSVSAEQWLPLVEVGVKYLSVNILFAKISRPQPLGSYRSPAFNSVKMALGEMLPTSSRSFTFHMVVFRNRQ